MNQQHVQKLLNTLYENEMFQEYLDLIGFYLSLGGKVGR
jgi:hypothetical protein